MTMPTGIYNARDFDIAMDGVTGDGAAINSMVAAIPEGSRVYFDGSDVLIDVPIVIDKDSIVFIGKGGQFNPDNGGRTRFFANTAIDIITWDKTPGDSTPSLAPDSGRLVNGGGLQNIVIDGSNGAANNGLRMVGVRNLMFRDVHVRGCDVNIDIDNHGTPPGGTDFWDSTTGIQFDHFESITVDGIGLRVSQGYSITFRDGTITATNTGVGVDLYRCDDVWFHDVRILTQNAAGTNVRGNGADYVANGGTGKAPTGVHFVTGYCNGVGTSIRMICNDFDLAPMFFWHGMGTEDGEPTLNLDAGAQFYYTDQLGHHTLRLHHARVSDTVDDFVGGSNTSGTIGTLGWMLAVTGSGIISPVDAVGNHPGMRRLDTGTTINSVSCMYLPANNTLGILYPGDSFDAEFIFKLNNIDAATICRVGFGLQPNVNPPVDGFYFEKLAADTSWFAVTRAAGVQTRTAAMLAANVGWMHGRIRRQGNAAIGFHFGDIINLADQKRVTTTIPTVPLAATFYLANTAASQKTMDIDLFSLHLRDLNR